MRIAIVLLFPRMRPHFETSLEIAQRHLDQGHEVTLITCSGQLAGCDSNSAGTTVDCLKCTGRRTAGMQALVGRPRVLRLDSFLPPAEACPLPKLSTRTDLWELRHRNFDWGISVASTWISQTRDPRINVEGDRESLERLLRGSWQVYEGVARILQSHSFDAVYVFNGRFSTARAVLRACQQEGVACRVHERGRDRYHFAIYHNVFPHDIDYVSQNIERRWEAARDWPHREQLAHDWFHARAGRKETNWRSFVADQDPDQLPEDWHRSTERVVVYTSSEDECAAIGDQWNAGVYSGQLEGLEQIAASWNAGSPSAHLWIRVHPNSIDLPAWYHERLNQLAGRNVSVIGAGSKVDSYALLRGANRVISFASTMGIEAVYWRIPSILIGNSFYAALGGTHRPTSHEDLLQLASTNLAPADRLPALKYGFYWATLGQPYRYFEPGDLFRGTFRGKRLRLSAWSRIKIGWYRLRKAG